MPSSSGDFSMTEASPVVRLIDARPARFAPLGGIRTWPLCHRPLSSQMTASIVHSTIARPAFGRLPVIVPRLVSNVSLLLKHGRGGRALPCYRPNNFLQCTFPYDGGLYYRQKKEPPYGWGSGNEESPLRSRSRWGHEATLWDTP